jgi:hypothetical protein
MLKRLRRHLSPPMVVSMIALFAALGGGYATAFSGSGTLQKANEIGISTTGYETIRTLTEVGSIQAHCDNTTGDISVRFHLTGFSMLVTGDGGASNPSYDYVDNSIDPNFDMAAFPNGVDVIRYHAIRTSGSKRPQVDVTVTVDSTTQGIGPCVGNQVGVMALNTEG